MTDAPVSGIMEWIRKTVEPRLGSVEIHPETRLLENGMLDSLQLMDLVFHMEEVYGVPVPLENLTPENFATPMTIAAMVGEGAR